MSRLRLDLHLNEQGLCTGGAFSFHNPADALALCEVQVQFPNDPEPAADASRKLVNRFLDGYGHQLNF